MLGRVWRILALATLVALAAVGAALLFFTRTGPGREQVRRLLVSRLDREVRGTVRIGRLGGDLLNEVELGDVALADSAGTPVLSVERIRARVDVWELFSKRIDVSSITLDRPVLLLRHLPGGGWNVARLFAKGERGAGGSRGTGFGRWVRIADARVRGGRLTVRTPWSPDTGLTESARDSAVAAALAGGTRARVERTAAGLEQVMDFRDLDAELPRVLVAHPDSARIVVEVARASLIAEPFRPPAADVRDLGGTLVVTSDSLRFVSWRVVLPESRMTLDIAYGPPQRSLRARLRADPFVLGDLQWLYPALPAEARGAVTVLATRADSGALDVRAGDLVARLDGAELTGTIGVALGEPFRLHDTDLRLTNLDTDVLAQVVPSLSLPARGTLSGRVRLAGDARAVATDAELVFDERGGGTSRVSATGTVAAEPAVGARDLRVRLAPLQTSLIRSAAPSLPVRGALAGVATVNGSADTRWSVRGDITHLDGGRRSRVVGSGIVAASGEQFRLDARVAPLDLRAVGRAAPSLGLRGAARGEVHASGTPDAVTFRTALRIAGGGAITAEGRAGRSPSGVAYDVVLRPDSLDPGALSARLPAGALTGTLAARGAGTDPATMRAAVQLALRASHIGRAAVDSLRLRTRVADGLAAVDTVAAFAPGARVSAGGTIGVAAGRTGTLRYAAHVDSLGALSAWAAGHRVAAADGDDGVAPDGALAGSVVAEGALQGGVARFHASGRATLRDVAARGGAIARGEIHYDVGHGREDTLTLSAALDTVRAGRLAYEHVDARLAATRRGGSGELRVRQSARAAYLARGDAILDSAGGGTLLLRELSLRLDSATWSMPRPATVAWHRGALRVDSLALRGSTGGSLSAAGELPVSGDGLLDLRAGDVPLGLIATLLQRDSALAVAGRISLEARVAGSAQSPRGTARARVADVVWRGQSVADVRAALDYADATLRARAEIGAEGAPALFRADARLPVNLALAHVSGPRLARGAPIVLDGRADSLSFALLPGGERLHALGGWARGEVSVRGTVAEPSVRGWLAVHDGVVHVAATGAVLRDLEVAARVTADSLVLDSLVGRSGGTVRAAGSVSLARGAPNEVRATITARDAAIVDGPQGDLHADADLAVSGTPEALLLTGRVAILHGFFEKKGPNERAVDVVGAGDPELFAVLDTSALVRRQSGPPREPPARTVRADLALHLAPDVWFRSSPNANIEISTPRDLRVRADLPTGDLATGGVVLTGGGVYVFRMRPFAIVRGAATASGVARVQPLLQLMGEHDVWIAGRGVLPLRIFISGSTSSPRFVFDDGGTPPAAPADLSAYLSLGRSPLSLLQGEGTSLAGPSAGGGRLAGELGALARRQEVSPAVGAVLYQLGKGARDALGARLFTVTPSDIPPELAESRFAGIAGTTVETGYLLRTRTYVAARFRLAGVAPALRLAHALGPGLELRAAVEPRFTLPQPSVGPPRQPVIGWGLGAFLSQEWWW